MESFEEGREGKIMEDLSKKAILNIFKMYFHADELETVVQQFDSGLKVETGSEKPSKGYVHILGQIEGLSDLWTAWGQMGGLSSSRPPLSLYWRDFT